MYIETMELDEAELGQVAGGIEPITVIAFDAGIAVGISVGNELWSRKQTLC